MAQPVHYMKVVNMTISIYELIKAYFSSDVTYKEHVVAMFDIQNNNGAINNQGYWQKFYHDPTAETRHIFGNVRRNRSRQLDENQISFIIERNPLLISYSQSKMSEYWVAGTNRGGDVDRDILPVYIKTWFYKNGATIIGPTRFHYTLSKWYMFVMHHIFDLLAGPDYKMTGTPICIWIVVSEKQFENLYLWHLHATYMLAHYIIPFYAYHPRRQIHGGWTAQCIRTSSIANICVSIFAQIAIITLSLFFAIQCYVITIDIWIFYLTYQLFLQLGFLIRTIEKWCWGRNYFGYQFASFHWSRSTLQNVIPKVGVRCQLS